MADEGCYWGEQRAIEGILLSLFDSHVGSPPLTLLIILPVYLPVV